MCQLFKISLIIFSIIIPIVSETDNYNETEEVVQTEIIKTYSPFNSSDPASVCKDFGTVGSNYFGYLCQFMPAFPTDLENFENVTVLDLGNKNNYIAELTEGIFFQAKLYSLNILLLSYCDIVKVDKEAFQGVIKIVRLDLSYNFIVDLPEGLFDKLVNLEALWLSGNPLGDLERPFPPLNLTELFLRNCSMFKISTDLFKNLKKLQILDLSGNKLITLELEAVLPLVSLKFIHLYGNSFNCDCSVKHLIDYCTNSSHLVSFTAVKSPTCRLNYNNNSFNIDWSIMHETSLDECYPLAETLSPSSTVTRRRFLVFIAYAVGLTILATVAIVSYKKRRNGRRNRRSRSSDTADENSTWEATLFTVRSCPNENDEDETDL